MGCRSSHLMLLSLRRQHLHAWLMKSHDVIPDIETPHDARLEALMLGMIPRVVFAMTG